MTPYLILDDKMVSALCVAAKTGVDVRIITPGIPDKWYVHAVTRANYEVLTEAGVRIFEYKPGFIHSKGLPVRQPLRRRRNGQYDFSGLYLHFEGGLSCICTLKTLRDLPPRAFYQRILRALLQKCSRRCGGPAGGSGF